MELLPQERDEFIKSMKLKINLSLKQNNDYIKARALDCFEARKLLKADEFTEKTDFNKEIELLLFDM